MSNPDGPSVLAAIHYVRDFHRTTAKLLLAADGIVAAHGWIPHDRSWKCHPGQSKSLAKPDRWMPHFVNRQYHSGKAIRGELLTVSAIPFDPIDERLDEPLLVASRMRAISNGNELYWIPLVGLRCRDGLGPFGEVRRIRRLDLNPKPSRLKNFDASVGGGELLSLVTPLVAICDDEALGRALKPILSAEYSLTELPSATVEA